MSPENGNKIGRRIGRKTAFVAGTTILASAALLGGERVLGAHGDKFSALSRDVIGTDNTIKLEDLYFRLKDKKDRLEFQIAGVEANPFGEEEELQPVSVNGEIQPLSSITSDEEANEIPNIESPVVEPLSPAPLILPEVKLLQPKPMEGEGIWTTDGLPRSTADDMLMAKTFIRPDTARPYSSVGVLLLDKRRIRLNIVGGIESPGGDLGVAGPGKIAESDLPNLMVAWKGGFLGPDGNYGMYADGKLYRPLVDGLASVAVTNEGEILMGEWGRSIIWRDDIVAVRQNAVLLVDNCEVTPLASEQGQNTKIWGRVWANSTEFITWRSAIGLTQNGDLMVAAGNSLSAATLARALKDAGVCTAMQLDINTPQVFIALYDKQPDGSLSATKFMNNMLETNPKRFLNTQIHDFMYVTLEATDNR